MEYYKVSQLIECKLKHKFGAYDVGWYHSRGTLYVQHYVETWPLPDQLYRIKTLSALAFHSLEQRGLNMFQYDSARLCARLIQGLLKVGAEELNCPAQSRDLNPNEHFGINWIPGLNA